MPHPDLANPAVAKRAALALANACGLSCRVEQRPDGTKRVIIGSRVIDCKTWLACHDVLYAIRLDSVLTERRRAAERKT